MKYTDPSGNIALIDDAILGLIGGTVNLLSNLGNIHSLGQGLGYFGVGFVSGALAEYITPVGSAALMGAGNAALGSYINTGHVDPGSVLWGAASSAGISLLTMGVGQATGLNSLVSKAIGGFGGPVVSQALSQGAIGAGLGSLGGGIGSVMNGGNFWQGAGRGALWGAGIGLVNGVYSGFQYAGLRDLNPWTGQPNVPLTPMVPIGCNGVSSGMPDNNDPNINVYRVFGDGSQALGYSWTPVDPNSVNNYRDAAGLPNVNTGRFVIEGTVNQSNIILQQSALPLNSNAGGLLEYKIDPNNIIINRVSGVNPPF